MALEGKMLIECDTCAVRGPACHDCVVSVLLGAPSAGSGEGAALDGAEQAAIAVLAGSGLVPPLRLLPLAPVERPGEGPPERPARCARPGAGSDRAVG
jgi:hypothetical protein